MSCCCAAAQRVPAEAFAGSRVLLACAHAGRCRLPTCRRWVAASTWNGGYIINHSKSFSSSIFSLEGELLGWTKLLAAYWPAIPFAQAQHACLGAPRRQRACLPQQLVPYLACAGRWLCVHALNVGTPGGLGRRPPLNLVGCRQQPMCLSHGPPLQSPPTLATMLRAA